MSRLMAAEDTEVYRAVSTIVRTGDRYRDGRFERTEVAGPYRTLGAARAALTRATNENTGWSRDTVTVTGHVERASIVWEPVT